MWPRPLVATSNLCGYLIYIFLENYECMYIRTYVRDLQYSTLCVLCITATKLLDTILYHDTEGN